MNNEDKNKLEEICKPTLLEYTLPIVGAIKYISRTSRQTKFEGINEMEISKHDRTPALAIFHFSELSIIYKALETYGHYLIK